MRHWRRYGLRWAKLPPARAFGYWERWFWTDWGRKRWGRKHLMKPGLVIWQGKA